MVGVTEGTRIGDIDCAYYPHHDGPAARAR